MVKAAEEGQTSRLVLRSIFFCHWPRLLAALCLQLFYSGLQFAGPLFLNQIVKFITLPESMQTVRGRAAGRWDTLRRWQRHCGGCKLGGAACALAWLAPHTPPLILHLPPGLRPHQVVHLCLHDVCGAGAGHHCGGAVQQAQRGHPGGQAGKMQHAALEHIHVSVHHCLKQLEGLHGPLACT